LNQMQHPRILINFALSPRRRRGLLTQAGVTDFSFVEMTKEKPSTPLNHKLHSINFGKDCQNSLSLLT